MESAAENLRSYEAKFALNSKAYSLYFCETQNKICESGSENYVVI